MKLAIIISLAMGVLFHYIYLGLSHRGNNHKVLDAVANISFISYCATGILIAMNILGG